MLHLSDIHATGQDDPGLMRGPLIIQAISNIEHEVDAAFIIVSGDLANTGNELEYFAVWQFLTHLWEGIAQEFNVQAPTDWPSGVIAVPGNHDCDFSTIDPLREILTQRPDLERLWESPQAVESCLRVQENFFSFLVQFGAGAGVTLSRVHPWLSYEYREQVGNVWVRFVCLNTAWLSTKNETQGNLGLPLESVPEARSDDEVVVTIFHHPLNWIDVDNTWNLRPRIEQISDMILTGHEHQAVTLTRNSSSGSSNSQLEAGAFQDRSNPADSEFKVIFVDTHERKQKVGEAYWNGSIYVFRQNKHHSDVDAFGLAWEHFHNSGFIGSQRFRLNQSTQQMLNDVELPVGAGIRRDLTLKDVFVFPDFEDLESDNHTSASSVLGENLVDLVEKDSPLLIVGERESGKTTLAKSLFMRLHEMGLVPILLDGKDAPPSRGRLDEWLVSKFSEMYSADERDQYLQLPRHRRAIIIDNFDVLFSSRKFDIVAEEIERFGGPVIMIGDQLLLQALQLEKAAESPKNLVPRRFLAIKAFGRAKREELVKRWVRSTTTQLSDSVSFMFQVNSAVERLNSLIGKNWLPPYPAYVLAILHVMSSPEGNNTSVGAQGSIYETLIRLALQKNRSQAQYNIAVQFLGELAHALFLSEKDDLSSEEFNEALTNFSQSLDLRLSDCPTKDSLIDNGLMVARRERLAFRHRYIFLFFVALWIKDHVSDQSVQTEIDQLTNRIVDRDSANVLLFLAHVTDETIIVNRLLEEAKGYYGDVTPSDLRTDIPRFEYETPMPEIVLAEDFDVDQNRKDHLQSLDDSEDDNWFESRYPEAYELISAVRLIDVMGQLLRNFPGSIKPETKIEIAKTCFVLGRKILASYYSLLAENSQDMISSAIETIRNESPDSVSRMTALQLQQVVVGPLILLTEALTSIVMTTVAKSLGAAELDRTFARIVGDDFTLADEYIKFLISLRTNPTFPEREASSLITSVNKLPFQFEVLRRLILSHFHMMPVSREIKHSVLNQLKVRHPQVIGANRGAMAIDSGRH